MKGHRKLCPSPLIPLDERNFFSLTAEDRLKVIEAITQAKGLLSIRLSYIYETDEYMVEEIREVTTEDAVVTSSRNKRRESHDTFHHPNYYRHLIGREIVIAQKSGRKLA